MPAPTPLLQVHYRRALSGMIAVCALVLIVGGGLGLIRAGDQVPTFIQWFIWSILALMVWGVLAGVRQLIKPPLMFIANRQGIVTYFLSDHVTFNGAGVLIPWSGIESMTLERRATQAMRSNRSQVWLIACRLKADADFDVPKHSTGYTAGDGQRVVCLDAFTGTLRKQELLECLQHLWHTWRSDGHADAGAF